MPAKKRPREPWRRPRQIQGTPRITGTIIRASHQIRPCVAFESLAMVTDNMINRRVVRISLFSLLLLFLPAFVRQAIGATINVNPFDLIPFSAVCSQCGTPASVSEICTSTDGGSMAVMSAAASVGS
jgi:hypothetical protein